MSWLSFFAGLVKLGNLLADYFRRRDAEADGAAIQRDADMRAENERVAKADIARDGVVRGGGVPVDQDPFNRDNG